MVSIKTIFLVALISAIILLFASSGCIQPGSAADGNAGNGSSTGGTAGGTGGAEPQTFNVSISGFAYNPASLSIKKGDTVIWTNNDSVQHTVTSDSGSELGSPMLSKGQVYPHIFSSPGTFDYYCIPHPFMKAKIIVQ